MARANNGWLEPASDLVLTTCAGFKSLQPLAQAIGNALIKAELEVQTVVQAIRTPVAPIQRVITPETYGNGHRHAPFPGNEQHHFSPQRGCQFGEAVCGKSRVVPIFIEGRCIQLMQCWPRFRLDLIAMPDFDFQTAFGDATTFGFYFSTLLRRKCTQETIEVTIFLVVPLKLDIVADQQSLRLE